MLYLVQLLLQVEQQPRQSDSRVNLSLRSLATLLQSASGVKSPGDEWRVGKKLTVKKRSTEQAFKNPSPAFIDLKRGLTGQLGAGHFHQGSSHAGLVAVLRFSDFPLLWPRAPPPILTRTRTLGFRFPRPQNCSPPPPAPSPRRHLGKVVLLTSFFTSVRSSSVRDGAVGSMAEAGDGASSGSRSSGCAAPPRLRASAFEWRGRREAERVERERAAPSRTDGLVSQTVPLPAEPRANQTYLSTSWVRSPGSFSLPEAQEQAPPLGGPPGEPAQSLQQPIRASLRDTLVPAPCRSLSGVAPPTASWASASGSGVASPKGIVSVGGVRSCSACLRSPPAQTVHRWSRVSAYLYFMVPPFFPDPIQRLLLLLAPSF